MDDFISTIMGLSAYGIVGGLVFLLLKLDSWYMKKSMDKIKKDMKEHPEEHTYTDTWTKEEYERYLAKEEKHKKYMEELRASNRARRARDPYLRDFDMKYDPYYQKLKEIEKKIK